VFLTSSIFSFNCLNTIDREDGDEPFKLTDFQKDTHSEYFALTGAEKVEYITAHQDHKSDLMRSRRLSAKS
jgi:hypothetical protein